MAHGETSLGVYWLLAAYLWLVSLISFGNWNAQPEPRLVAALRAGQSLTRGDAIPPPAPAVAPTLARPARPPAPQ